ncbi:MAG: DNA polymerase III subunit delta [Candidatus Buchananbacteria bacterium]
MLFFLFGPDTFRSQQKLQELEQKFIKEKDKSGLNVIKLTGENLTLGAWQQAVMSSAFLAEKKLIITKNLITNGKKAELEKIKDWLIEKNWQLDNIVVFWEPEFATNDRRQKLPELLSQAIKTKTAFNLGQTRLKPNKDTQVYWQEFTPLTDQELTLWLRTATTTQQAKISSEAINSLVFLVGNDLFRLQQELNKLIALKLDAEITATDVKENVLALASEDIFKLIDAVGQKNKKLASKLLQQQLAAGDSELAILTRLTWYFRVLIRTKDLLDRQGGYLSPEKIAKELEEKPFTVQKAYNQLKNFSLLELKNIYQAILETEAKIKSSQAKPVVLLDLLFTKLTT